jgi:anti-anti-sigma factor
MTHTPSQTPVGIHLVTHVGTGEPHGAELPGPVLAPRTASFEARAALAVSSVTTRTDGDRFVVELAGDVDLVLVDRLALAVRQADRHCAQHPRARVHLDVREVTAVDASAIRFLERLRRDCAAHGARCTTSSARPAVEQVLALARPVVDGELAAS